MKKGTVVTLTKQSDDVFKGLHPGGIYEGYSKTGTLEEDLKVGERCTVNDYKSYLSTSVVTEIIDENTFKTKNSTYKIEEFNSEI